MNELLELELQDTFERRAAAPVDTAALAVLAVRRGRRRRSRLRAVRGLCLAVVITAAAALVPLASAPPAPRPAIDSRTWSPPALPIAAGVPGAWDAPLSVGTDPSLLHFTVEEWPTEAETVTWSSGGGAESLAFTRGPAGFYEVALARTTAALDTVRDARNRTDRDWAYPATEDTTVTGRPATLSLIPGAFLLRWQPIDGVWAQVYGHGTPREAGAAQRIAGMLRLGTTYRCVAPVRLTATPPGARLASCTLSLLGADSTDAAGRPTRLGYSLLTVATATGRAEVRITPTGAASPGDPANDIEVAGHPGRLFTASRDRPAVTVPDFAGVSVQVIGAGDFTSATVRGIAGGIEVAADHRTPAGWPPSPLP